MAGGWKAAHIGADLGNDNLRGQVTDARDGPQLADRVTERVKIAIHLGVDLGDGGVECIEVPQMQTQWEAVPPRDAFPAARRAASRVAS